MGKDNGAVIQEQRAEIARLRKDLAEKTAWWLGAEDRADALEDSLKGNMVVAGKPPKPKKTSKKKVSDGSSDATQKEE